MSANPLPPPSSFATPAEAWEHIKANRPPNGQVLFGPLREAIDMLDPIVQAALTAEGGPRSNEHEYQLIADAVGERGMTDASTPLYIRVQALVDEWDTPRFDDAEGEPPHDAKAVEAYLMDMWIQLPLEHKARLMTHTHGQGLDPVLSFLRKPAAEAEPPAALVALVREWQAAHIADVGYRRYERAKAALLAWTPGETK